MTIDRRHFLVAAVTGFSSSAMRGNVYVRDQAREAPAPFSRSKGEHSPPPGKLRLDPKDDGAVLDGVADDTLALAKLVARIRAKGSNPVIVDFGGGTMRAGPVPNANTAISVGAGSNVTLRNGRLLIKGASIADYPFAAVYGNRFESFTLDTFEIDYENPPYFQAKCVAISGSDLQFDWAGYWSPSFDDVQSIYERHAISHDPLAVVTFAPSASTAFKIDTRSGTTLWLRGLTDIVTPPAIGKLYTISHRNFQANAIAMEGGSNLTMIDSKIRAAAGAGVFARYVDQIRISNHDQSPSAGSRRWQTTNVDALHFDMCSGRIDISDSTFGFCGDDALNVVAREYQAVDVSRRTFKLVAPGSNPQAIESGLVLTEAGDQLAFTDDEGIPQGVAIITGQTGAGTTARTITVDSLPPGLKSSWRINLLRYSPTVRIINNRIGRNRGRGIVGIARNVEIRNNRISGSFSTGIEVGVSPYQKGFSEGELQAKSIVVEANIVERCAADRAYTSAAIIVAAYKPDGSYAAYRAGCDAKIVNNTVRDCENSAILVSGFTNVSVKGNAVANVASNPFATTIGTTSSAIAVMNCNQVTITGNRSISGASTIGIFGTMGPDVVLGSNPGMRVSKI